MNNESFWKATSYSNQKGVINRINTKSIPNGLWVIAPVKSPFTSDTTERVEPHEGQGIFVAFLIKQTLWAAVTPLAS